MTVRKLLINVAGQTQELPTGDTVDKAVVGLGNVDNTSDVDKPVSTAQAASIASKLNLSGGTMLGSVTFSAGSLQCNAGSIRCYGSTAGYFLGDRSTSTVYAYYSSADIFYIYSSLLGNNIQQIDSSGNFGPGEDNTASCGLVSARWSVVYAGTGTINTSDARKKTPVVDLTPSELAAAADMSRAIGTYQWLESVAQKGDVARHHAGLTVQRAIDIMQSHGLDPMRYGFICYDAWPAQEAVVTHWPAQEAVLDDSGNVVTPAVESYSEVMQPARPKGDLYSFRTDELCLFIARGFAARLDILEAK